MKISIFKILIIVAIVISTHSCNIGEHILEEATENMLPVSDNILSAAAQIEQATGNLVPVSDNLVDAIGELENTIAALEQAGTGILGSAGDEMQDVIEEFSSSAEDVIQMLESSGMNIIEQSEVSAIKVVSALTNSAKSLIQETDDMVRNNLQCIDKVTAMRIAQVLDSSSFIIDKLNVLVNETIITISGETQTIIRVAGQEVSLTISKTIYSIVSVAMIALFLLFIAAIAYMYAYKIRKNSNVFKKYVSPSICFVLGLTCLLFFLSPVLLWSKLGYAVLPPVHDETLCEDVIDHYTNFIESYNNSLDDNSKYLKLGLIATESIHKCCLWNPNDKDVEFKLSWADNIEALLFPPPPPPSASINYADCNTGRSKKSYHPRIFSNKVKVKTQLLDKLKLSKAINFIPNEKKLIDQVRTPDVTIVKPLNFTEVYTKSLAVDALTFNPNSKLALHQNLKVPAKKIIGK